VLILFILVLTCSYVTLFCRFDAFPASYQILLKTQPLFSCFFDLKVHLTGKIQLGKVYAMVNRV